ncbi:RNA-dependent RNA polymerase 1-like [Rhododendron vialii]|uniref:RNA-dependent RNA polymerase 1-like n=1 Tax=Rhododendron vialii TaxID=182163 RepID=UPI00265E12F4|nr:RNA-dependent RNA polymerase 1-like [Rhododendron vialii]XP_058184042.1 RNA-dependent RNA polymerase 1-like [Rhododendron vialii]XP_058184043.1 RNA-dependent RNA polymerase 1-like [Rhododendron vialii]XP_058184044.1 RNA-dependent RNA polymerase 1-like [Rhododendron vialii]
MGKTISLFGFPYVLSGEIVKEFIERYTGGGTVVALEVREPKKKGSRACAIVQFTNTRSADKIITLANQKLYYGRSYLKASTKNFDLVPNPKKYEHVMEGVTIYCGCQISKEKFSVLWEREDITVKFGFGLRKVYFFMSYLALEYKLELFYENILKIELHRPRGQTAKFLLIQLLGAPRIYKKCEQSVYNYFKETPEDQWVRATDFTSLNRIGQSSALCMELPYGVPLLDLVEYFPSYKENQAPFILETGFPFSCILDLVPIVGPPDGIELPYKILFKICILVQEGYLAGPTLDINFFRLVDPQFIHIGCIEHALEKLYHLKECCYEPGKWLNEEYIKYRRLRKLPRTPTIKLDDGLVYVHRVQITPCKVFFCGPEVNMSNRVLREYRQDIENFLRVSFVDEELGKMFSTDLSPRTPFSSEERRTQIYSRILSVLRDGIVIGNKKFDFLAFSSSQLRDNSAWMFASRNGRTAADIRNDMGNFRQIRNVAKYAARLGQSFSSSTETLSVARDDIEVIPDVEIFQRGTKYVFSDGIGKMSDDFARRVAKKCGLKSSTPSAFQIRYGGYKGVVAVDPTSWTKMSLRPSMCKYECDNTKLDVLAWSKYQPCFLNRQLITLLSTLGVNDFIFEKKQREAVEQLDTILTDPLRAQDALELMSPGENTNILKEMLMCGYKPDAEPFLSMMLQTFRAAKLFEIRTKTRVFVPRGRSMMGCLDETRTLEYGEVFVQISEAGNRSFHDNSLLVISKSNSDQGNRIVKGEVFVAKNPCLHPGDVRVLKAVDVPALHHMVDCVVFPQKGMRPHPNECSGSDLDGDIYFVCWDPDLVPPQQIPAMDYTPAPTVELDHDVTIEEIEEYFTNYIVNDSLGIIANAHTVFADAEPEKALSAPCVRLAELFSIAVDFPKTGVPAEIPRELRVQTYPDFMEKPDKPTYKSERVIGKLFRAVKDIAPETSSTKSFTKEVALRSYDHDLKVDGFRDYLEDAFDYKTEYDYKLGNLMDYYGIKTEAELLSGSIMKMSKSFDRRKDAEEVGLAVRALRKEARTWFNTDAEGDDVYAKASAWYYVTYHHSYWGRYNMEMNREHFISFPWCVYDKLIHIKKDKASIRRALHLSSLERQFSYGLNFR